MRLESVSFSQMKQGIKTSELRLNDEKRQRLQVGDTIVFINTADPQETLHTTVTYLRHYPDFTSLYEGVRADYPAWDEPSFIHGMYRHYTPEEEQPYGALEIGILITPTDAH